jgi:hypothetical protein
MQSRKFKRTENYSMFICYRKVLVALENLDIGKNRLLRKS